MITEEFEELVFEELVSDPELFELGAWSVDLINLSDILSNLM